jgi:hypothetical protein
MTDEANPDDAQPQGSVFGNLPESRPGTRSPRRGQRAGRTTKPKAETKRRPAAKPKPRPAEPASDTKPKAATMPPPRRSEQPPAEAPDERQGGGLEDLAWAGVAAAAEAATLGVKLANRALEALRGNSERS